MWGMNISDYLSQTSKKSTEFAKELGVTHSAVSKWCKGKTTPSKATMQLIKHITGGLVTADDFYSSPLRAGNELREGAVFKQAPP